MWPTCLNELSEFSFELKTEIPKFLKKVFKENDAIDSEEYFIPVRPITSFG